MPKTFSPNLKDVVTELKRRRSFNIDNYLFKEQLDFVNDPAPFKTAVTTRRAGKTVACAADLLNTAINTPNVVCLYITLSRNNAKKLVWAEMKKMVKKFDIMVNVNESDLSLKFPNDSVIYCSGASDRTEIEKFRGLALKKVYIDEAQSFPDYIEELVNSVLSPALIDHAGSLCLIGTPGPVSVGYFYECSQSNHWSHHFWTFFDNKFLPALANFSHQELLERDMKSKGLTVDHPSIQREWFGKWINDADSLVFHYDKSINDYNDFNGVKPNYVLGVDLGYDDADALAVLAWSESSPNTYLVEEKVTRKQGISDLIDQIDALKKKYDISKIVVDTGGLGKKIAESLSSRYKTGVEPAEKTRKNEYIALMNDALRTGRLLAKSNSLFAQDCMKLEWDRAKSTPDKQVVSKRFHSDICDAVLYAWRCSYAFAHTPAAPPPKPGAPEWFKEEIERMEQAAQDHFEALERMEKEGWE